jgi:ABC-2 type transport system permease protein/lipopolysaccharide transport system permease protein
MYSLSVIPDPWRNIYAVVNPIAGSIDAMRTIVIDGQWPNFALLAGALVWASFGTAVGYWIFKRLERGLADRV